MLWKGCPVGCSMGIAALLQCFHLGKSLCPSAAAGVHRERYTALGCLSFGYGLLLSRTLSISRAEAVLGSPPVPLPHTHSFTYYTSCRPGLLNEIVRGKECWIAACTFRNCFFLFIFPSFRNDKFFTLFFPAVGAKGI